MKISLGFRSAPLCALLLTGIVLFPASGRAQEDRMSATERLDAFAAHEALVENSRFGALPWQHLGPTNISGRVVDVAVAEPRGGTYTMYVGAAGGGVWKT